MALAPFEVLAGLAHKSRKSAKGLPQKIQTEAPWRGLGFSLLGSNFVAPMGQVSEMMEMPSASTRLPGVQPWVLGLSNVRGRLLPLFDLSMFLGGELGQQRKVHRVLVLETTDLYSGLIVERAMGMQQFQRTQFDDQADIGALEAIKPYLNGAFTDDQKRTWHVFDFMRLAADQRFANASLV